MTKEEKLKLLLKFKTEVQKIDVEGWDWDRGEDEIIKIIAKLVEEDTK